MLSSSLPAEHERMECSYWYVMTKKIIVEVYLCAIWLISLLPIIVVVVIIICLVLALIAAAMYTVAGSKQDIGNYLSFMA